MLRKTLLFLVASALVATPLTSADAASQYKISSISVSPRLLDIHHSTRVTISGRVTGGPVKGRTVHITAINTDDGNKAKSLGQTSLTSTGRFSKKFTPQVGGRWKFKVVRPDFGSTKGATRFSTTIDAFHWAYLSEFYTGTNTPALVQQQDRSIVAAHREKTGGRNYPDAFFINGGGTVIFDSTGFQCKKIQFHIGVSDRAKSRYGKFKVDLVTPSGKTTKFLVSKTMKRGATPYEPSKSIRDKMSAGYRVRVHVYGDASTVRFVLGDPKVFCTFPSRNTNRN